MESLISGGKTRFIGVSNFSPGQLQKLIDQSAIMPAVHQMELHPYLQQTAWIDWHRQQGIHVTAYSPLGNMNPIYGERDVDASKYDPPLLVHDKVLGEIARKRDCTIPQVALAWGMSRGTSVIPKSKHPQWIQENFHAKKCKLEFEDLQTIKELGEKFVKRYNNPSENWGVDLFQGLDDS
jgi:alcohol dehydrogenase (NADP+)